MRLIEIGFSVGFTVLETTPEAQVATMVIGIGESAGGPDNMHERSDQWLYVVSGLGVATVGDEIKEIGERDLLLIKAGETHKIRNIGNHLLLTLNFFAPPEARFTALGSRD